MAHFIPLSSGSKTAEDLACIFVRDMKVARLAGRHCLGPRLQVHRGYLESLSCRIGRVSTAFHPQTDGQTERTKQVIEAYLRSFVNSEQGDWWSCSPMAEYPYNSSITTATELTPSYANYGRRLETAALRLTEMQNPASLAYAQWMTSTIAKNRKALEATRERMAKYADKHRAEPPAYKIGDLVMLSSAHDQM